MSSTSSMNTAPCIKNTGHVFKCRLASTRSHALRVHLEAHWDGYIRCHGDLASQRGIELQRPKCCSGTEALIPLQKGTAIRHCSS